jgi:short-subunit dehydrogenase
MKQRALITGSSSGIGFEYAKYLSKRGWDLDLVSNNEDRLIESKKKLSYKNANFFSYDLGENKSIESILESFQTPNLIVANAGEAVNGPIGKLNRRQRQYYYYLMCGGVIDLIEGFVPKMLERGSGRIVIISSIGAISPMPKSSLYASIKSGIYNYGRSIATELKDKNIHVTVSLPGYVKTNAHDRVGLKHLKKNIPNWMWVTPLQVVKETENASIQRKSEIIPGYIYKLTKPFLGNKYTTLIWRFLTKSKR